MEVAKKKLIEQNKADTEYTKSLGKEEAKQFSEMEKQASEGIKAQPLYNELKSVVSNPTFEKIRQHPYAGHLEMGYYKRSKNKDEADIANRFELVTNEIIASTAKNLNTRFTNKDLELAQRMKITDRDSLNSVELNKRAYLIPARTSDKRLDREL